MLYLNAKHAYDQERPRAPLINVVPGHFISNNVNSHSPLIIDICTLSAVLDCIQHYHFNWIHLSVFPSSHIFLLLSIEFAFGCRQSKIVPPWIPLAKCVDVQPFNVECMMLMMYCFTNNNNEKKTVLPFFKLRHQNNYDEAGIVFFSLFLLTKKNKKKAQHE